MQTNTVYSKQQFPESNHKSILCSKMKTYKTKKPGLLMTTMLVCQHNNNGNNVYQKTLSYSTVNCFKTIS